MATGFDSPTASASASESDNRGVAHSVDVEKLTLENHVGQNVDLRAIFTEYTTTSSMFEPGIVGSVLINDAHSLINRHPIVGEETLHVSFKTPGNAPKTGKFSVWKVTDEQPDPKGLSSVYRLHFCSPVMLRNASRVVAKSYSTDDAKKIVAGIVSEYLDLGVDDETVEYGTRPMMDPAKKLVVPMYRPLEAIDMVLRRAYSGDETASDYYVFFQRYDGWKLFMVDELVERPINAKQRAAGITSAERAATDPSAFALETWYEYASARYVDDGDRARDIRRIIGLNIGSRFDTIAKIRGGAFQNEVATYSIVDKAFYSKLYNSIADERRLLGGPPPDGDTGTHFGTGAERTNTADFISDYSIPGTGFTGSQASRVFFRMKDPNEKDGVTKKSGWRYAALRNAMQIQVSITVPGDTMVDVGDVVHLSLPKFESVLENGERDEFLYGRYLVGAIRDNILTPDKHVMTLDLWRDAYSSPIGINEFLGKNHA